jgi:hypothetical protein
MISKQIFIKRYKVLITDKFSYKQKINILVQLSEFFFNFRKIMLHNAI